MKYPVNWRNLWKSLSKTLVVIMTVIFMIILLTNLYSNDFDVELAFEHIELIELPLWFLGIVVISIGFSFVIAVTFKLATIEIINGTITGRNYWFFQKTVPFKNIQQLYWFSDNGVEAIVVDGGIYGSVYISIYTENIDEILGILGKHCSLERI